LEEISISQLIDVAIECVSNGIESDSLYILAGLNEKDEYDISLYFKLALKELNIEKPTKIEAVKYLIKYYCNQLLNKNITPEAFLHKIVREIERKYTAPNYFGYTNAAGYTFDLMKEETKYVRDILGLGDYLDWRNVEYSGDFWGVEGFEGIYWSIDHFKKKHFFEKLNENDKIKCYYINEEGIGIDKEYTLNEIIEISYENTYKEAEEYLSKYDKNSEVGSNVV
jgi:hypothetical protein